MAINLGEVDNESLSLGDSLISFISYIFFFPYRVSKMCVYTPNSLKE